jgi:CDP-glycerol glycerophosphotransferase
VKLPFVKNANNYPDIQELMMAIDMGITDYSSWICDYVLTYKPGLLYTPDLDSYDVNRGFYYPLEETPFPICRTNDELVENILKFDGESYKNRTDEFLKRRACIDDGHASEHIVDMLEEKVEK